jgi:hypothetical protein
VCSHGRRTQQKFTHTKKLTDAFQKKMGGVSSKESFGFIIHKLLTTDIEPTDHGFWDELWKTTLTTEDIFDVISPADVRKLVNEKPLNLKILFTQAVAQLYQVVETPYPSTSLVFVRVLPFGLSL